MNKVVRNGAVAVLYSPGYGAGWFSWNQERPEILFDPWIVDVLTSSDYDRAEKIRRIQAHCAVKYPDIYLGGVKDLRVEWVPQGDAFRINEYDGAESIEYRDMADWITA